MTYTGEQKADRMDSEQPEEIVNGEFVGRAEMHWFMEKLLTAPVMADEEEVADEGQFMVLGTLRERDDMISVMKFHEKKYPEDTRRVLRREVRYYLDDLSEEETS